MFPEVSADSRLKRSEEVVDVQRVVTVTPGRDWDELMIAHDAVSVVTYWMEKGDAAVMALLFLSICWECLALGYKRR